MPVPGDKGLVSRLASWISRMPSSSVHQALAEEQAGFLKAQRLAYQCVLDVEKEMREGWTEKQTAERMDTYLKDHGVPVYLHRPFAWFGNHARFDEYRGYGDYHPSDRVLKAGEPYILDVSPVVDGYIGDIGYSSCLGPHAGLDAGIEFLLDLRENIRGYFASGMNASEIWWQVDEDIKQAGYDNIHARYPMAVLGHRVYRVDFPNTRLPRIPLGAASWFSLQGTMRLLSRKLLPELLGPDHEGEKIGLWAIEPHVGKGAMGFKFEEILVVDKDRVYWLDEDVPHVRRGRMLAEHNYESMNKG